ncbi:hypothetical protein [Actinacidiphila yeochonensis]|uniref:hypothetical protein n=1 Tax=Actinacidiphila yeochonensis TaxID=89050 RepID=UPI00056C8AFF|nr:hypothetical protein [Actinacidiphila yeochonensis]
MKTTLNSRQKLANPRRTTLAHLKDVSELAVVLSGGTPREQQDVADAAPVAGPAEPRTLPQRTANPRRTVLDRLPEPRVPEAS